MLGKTHLDDMNEADDQNHGRLNCFLCKQTLTVTSVKRFNNWTSQVPLNYLVWSGFLCLGFNLRLQRGL